jgi:hypothetical protein
MKTYSRAGCTAVLGAVMTLFWGTAALGAQEVFQISKVGDSDVLVQPYATAKDTPSTFTPFEIFDVYETRDAETGLSGFVDSLYFSQTGADGILLKYVWKGEKKFLKPGYFAVRTGKIYSVAEDASVKAGPTLTPATSPASLAPVASSGSTAPSLALPGSFGVTGLELTADVGGGVADRTAVISVGSTTQSNLAAVTMAVVKLRYYFFGVSARANVPLSFITPTPMPVSFSGCLDLYWDVIPILGMYGSVGGTLNITGPITLAGGYGVYSYLPIFGQSSSFTLYLEFTIFCPSIALFAVDYYYGLGAGLRF